MPSDVRDMIMVAEPAADARASMALDHPGIPSCPEDQAVGGVATGHARQCAPSRPLNMEDTTKATPRLAEPPATYSAQDLGVPAPLRLRAQPLWQDNCTDARDLLIVDQKHEGPRCRLGSDLGEFLRHLICDAA